MQQYSHLTVGLAHLLKLYSIGAIGVILWSSSFSQSFK